MTRALIVFWLVLFSAVFSINFNLVGAAVMHSHTSINKEHIQDSFYSPKDKNHYSEDGEHDIEFDHEAILGSVKEAETFDHLPLEESKKRLKILLEKIDLNGDKIINKQELKVWILRSFKMLSEEEANERLEDVDENNDGKVTWEEYITDTYGKDDELPVEQEDKQLLEDDKRVWEVADFDKNNFLENEEWLAFLHPEEHPAMIPHILEQTLSNKDKNGDGSIDFQEFIGTQGQERSKEWLLSEKDKFDLEYDKNADGKLSGNEIISWIVPNNE
ncbi:reticulocalbin-2 isoform X2 [Agrilus planipennis]|uniref:Reticulocalbin-3 n=1 Tax=Agrilus planipennis TaxID=224129 RepID=A0A1W4XCC3_AGRPL|nr:reticulocalbin-2 isoform X2 [Agrilus planipennis]